ncbi:2Fe-2S iron-sulfur cluster-binding protein [Sphingomonas sp. 35-24ZXX]|jgi:ferredoxin|uniref:2Fe-2S iron-sulfur cluster-binding protein n=1 Tax=Sphingomonas sp. 35-24ZXX TaxID=1545915 RepID=UPI00053BF841|nr:2Fe-2S iron-sulfur cluster-binding protein [Sphingomonas sp. 35-24ZXX]
MIEVIFISADGKTRQSVQAKDGDRLLDVAQAHGLPLEGTCEGQMACSTCHLIIDAADFAKLPEPVEMEEDMLDLAVAVTRTSRLSCQIFLREEWGSLTCRVPAESYDMQGM